MRKTLKEIALWLNQGLIYVLTVLIIILLAIGNLVVILLSPLIAFVGTNSRKLGDEYEQGHMTSASWWKTYKTDLVFVCTEMLPTVVYKNNF